MVSYLKCRLNLNFIFLVMIVGEAEASKGKTLKIAVSFISASGCLVAWFFFFLIVNKQLVFAVEMFW